MEAAACLGDPEYGIDRSAADVVKVLEGAFGFKGDGNAVTQVKVLEMA